MSGPAPGVISGVRPGSLAEEAGIAAGDSVVTIGGEICRDVIDYQFHQADSEVSLHLRTAQGLDDLIVFEKEIDEDLGIEFERATWDDVILCNNNCFFCFLKGLPKGMRKTLYMKDDDFRLSFLHGNFVTLTNLTEENWQRLDQQRLSPLNVSVHATELDLRRKMLSNTTAPDIIEQMQRLAEMGIEAHTQIVLCPGVNDGVHLERSLRDLAALYPTVQTVSVVPVGASPKLEEWSSKRDGIDLVRPNYEAAKAILSIVKAVQQDTRKRTGHSVVQCADEYYLVAGERVPGAPSYEGYPQYENGIGMVRHTLQDWTGTKRKLKNAGPFEAAARRLVIGTGSLVGPQIAEVAAELAALTNTEIEVRPVTNTVFGERVNVSGLLCGGDYINQLKDASPDVFVLPRPSLDYFGKQFLDSRTAEEVEEALGAPVAYVSQWSEVVEVLRHGARPPERSDDTHGAFWSEHHTLEPGAAWVTPE